MWRHFISQLSEEYTFNKRAEAAKLEEIKRKFHIQLPSELESLLNEIME